MPHPEINNQTVTTKVVQTRASPSWNPGYVFSTTNTEALAISGNWEKESSNNPVRADGTRAISTHWIDRVLFSAPQQPVSSTPAPGYDVWFLQHSASAPRNSEVNYINPRANINSFVPPTSYGVEAKAKLNFLKKLGDAKGQAIEFGVMTGEFRETVHMAIDAAVGIYAAAKSVGKRFSADDYQVNAVLRHQARKRAAMTPRERLALFGSKTTDLPEKIVDAWLIEQFGIKPLISDITNATSYLMADLVEGEKELFATIRSGSEETSKYKKLIANDYLGHYNMNGVFQLFERVHISARYKIPTNRNVARELGFQNQASVIWELVAYSWMVDYVVGVGAWLQALTAAAGTTFIEGTISYLHQARLQGLEFVQVSDKAAEIFGEIPNGPMLFELDRFKRELLTPVGVLPPPTPVLKEKLGLTQLANALSVLKNFGR